MHVIITRHQSLAFFWDVKMKIFHSFGFQVQHLPRITAIVSNGNIGYTIQATEQSTARVFCCSMRHHTCRQKQQRE